MAILAQWDSGPLHEVAGANPPTIDGEDMVLTGPGDGSARWVINATQYSARFYLTTPAIWASTATPIFRAVRLASPTNTSGVAIAGTGAPGQARFTSANGVNTASSTNGILANSTRYRFEFQVDGTNVTGRVFLGDSATPIYDPGPRSGVAAGPYTSLQIGRLVANNGSELRLSRLLVTDALEWLGPHGSGQSVASDETYWDGATEWPVTETYWDGATEHAVID